jgi:hypothetical protein
LVGDFTGAFLMAVRPCQKYIEGSSLSWDDAIGVIAEE